MKIIVVWIIFCSLLLSVLNLKTDVKTEAELSDQELRVSEADNNWSYDLGENPRYLEISLNNPGGLSREEFELVMDNQAGKLVRKTLSGFNTGDRGWVRVDLPAGDWSKTVIRRENLRGEGNTLAMSLDKFGKPAVRVFSRERTKLPVMLAKIMSVWWWWAGLLGVSVVYATDRKKD